MSWERERLHAHIRRTEELLAAVARADGPEGVAGGQAVQALVDLYGEALARVMDVAARAGFAAELLGDELLEHLLLVHGLHPDPPETRARRAVEELRPKIAARGGDVEFLGVTDGVARVRLGMHGCSSTAAQVAEALEDEIVAAAPEITGVETVAPEPEPVLVPLDQLMMPTGPRPGG